jgi:hypothetical protein
MKHILAAREIMTIGATDWNLQMLFGPGSGAF